MMRTSLREGGSSVISTSADVPSPVANWQTNVIQTSSSDSREIRFGNPLSSRCASPNMKAVRGNRGRERIVPSRESSTPLPRTKRKSAYSVPVPFENLLSDRTRLELAERPFIDDVGIAGFFKKTGGDPGLYNRFR